METMDERDLAIVEMLLADSIRPDYDYSWNIADLVSALDTETEWENFD